MLTRWRKIVVWLETGEYWLLYAHRPSRRGTRLLARSNKLEVWGTGLWGWHKAPVTWVLERAGATVPRGVLNRVHGLCGLWLTRVHAIILVVGTEGARVEDDYRASNVFSAGPSAQGRLQLSRVCVALPNAVDETAQSTIRFGQYPELSETGACFVLLHTWVGRLYFFLVPNIS